MIDGLACMGGWCKCRDRCALHVKEDREHVVERLCPPNEEHPVWVVSPVIPEREMEVF